MSNPQSEYDPITFSVILSRFNNIANEMTLTLEYTAWTSILALARDYSCAIYDAVPRQIAMFDALPVHTTSLHLVLSEIAETFEGRIHEGDVFLCNHPFRRNTHVGDVVTAQPVFFEGEHVFWSVTKGHQLDIGAAAPTSVSASARHVFQEGIHIPPVRIYERGEAREDVIDFYLSNVRFPDLLRGDLLAQLGSIGKGNARLIELCQEYGIEQVKLYVDAIIDYADRRMAEEIRAMPDGVYEAETWVDSDGVSTVDIPIKVKVEIDGDMIRIDYTGSGPQTPSGINGTYATSQAAPAVPFLFYIAPDIPHNHGCFKHIEMYSPEGTICNARYPASTALATVVPSDAMQDAVNKAMAQALPERVLGGGPRAGNTPNFTGVDARSGKEWGAMIFNNAGGGGAGRGSDGWPLISTQAAAGGLKSLEIEQMELLYPLLIEQMDVEPDSMGMGEWIGGPGVRLSVTPTHGDVECATHGDGFRNPPHGVLGATAGAGGGQYIERAEGGPRSFVSSTGYFELKTGERLVGVSSGGGGYGRAVDRDAEQVRRDVRDGFITHEAAAEIFGVVVSDAFDPVIDVDATALKRAELRKVETPVVVPLEPGASTWLADNQGADDEYLLNPVLR